MYQSLSDDHVVIGTKDLRKDGQCSIDLYDCDTLFYPSRCCTFSSRLYRGVRYIMRAPGVPHILYLATLATAFLPLARAFSFNTSKPTQCGNLTVQW